MCPLLAYISVPTARSKDTVQLFAATNRTGIRSTVVHSGIRTVPITSDDGWNHLISENRACRPSSTSLLCWTLQI